MPYTHEDKSSGQLIRSADWNSMGHAIQDLDKAKVNRSGDVIQGELKVTGRFNAPEARIDGSVTTGGSLTVAGALDVGTNATIAALKVNTNLVVAGALVPSAGGTEAAGIQFPNNAFGGGGDAAWIRYHNARGGEKATLEIGITDNVDDHIVLMPSGNVGINNQNPVEKLDVGGNLKVAGSMTLGGSLVVPGVASLGGLVVNGTATAAYFQVPNSAIITGGRLRNAQSYSIVETNQVDWLRINPDQNFSGIAMYRPVAMGSGGLVVGAWEQPGLGIQVTNGPHRVALGVPFGKYGGDGIRGTPNLWLDAAGQVVIKAGFGTQALDLAERFPTDGPVAPGEVLVFRSDAHAASPCDREGDTRVIGVVSTEPGCILGLDETHAPVALCGTVPCRVDATIAPIEVGDLLTTSSTKGHAQKALDPAHSQGAIIGKALAPIKAGKGEIPILVFLQ